MDKCKKIKFITYEAGFLAFTSFFPALYFHQYITYQVNFTSIIVTYVLVMFGGMVIKGNFSYKKQIELHSNYLQKELYDYIKKAKIQLILCL